MHPPKLLASLQGCANVAFFMISLILKVNLTVHISNLCVNDQVRKSLTLRHPVIPKEMYEKLHEQLQLLTGDRGVHAHLARRSLADDQEQIALLESTLTDLEPLFGPPEDLLLDET